MTVYGWIEKPGPQQENHLMVGHTAECLEGLSRIPFDGTNGDTKDFRSGVVYIRE